jgi:hypothetical protein
MSEAWRGRLLKIRLDENISHRIASAVIAVAGNRSGYEVSCVTPGSGPDPDWIKKFAEEGGTAILSGDHNILQHWPNLIAYTESGLISFFPPSEYEHLKGFARAAFLIRWWPAIVEKTKQSKSGDRWRLPMNWRDTDPNKMISIKDPRVDGDKKLLDTSKLKQASLNLATSNNAGIEPQ